MGRIIGIDLPRNCHVFAPSARTFGRRREPRLISVVHREKGSIDGPLSLASLFFAPIAVFVARRGGGLRKIYLSIAVGGWRIVFS
jgi:hypothetical protein